MIEIEKVHKAFGPLEVDLGDLAVLEDGDTLLDAWFPAPALAASDPSRNRALTVHNTPASPENWSIVCT